MYMLQTYIKLLTTDDCLCDTIFIWTIVYYINHPVRMNKGLQHAAL